ncbi:NapC/NirT family cytochrome c [Anaeromyxobacter paludicola]|uniref:NapC/NirT cytochrome c N-terminal domain-containing protein n=1 Tax=Anaeromyxobacter paludicola TaxID=2918171 RepID=A0ABN6N8K7_9BACT|nr:NapC/NirT family cytochrome c [Anaeromyxobacter paludicola]BDG09544.1 hypothetical protein AMPC_26570 [Anaeromyxobacter paludicola]
MYRFESCASGGDDARRSALHLLRRTLLVALGALVLWAGPAGAQTKTYRWQPNDNTGTFGGYTVSYGAWYNSWGCSAASNVVQRRVTSMNTSSTFACNTGTYVSTSQSGPFELLLAISDAAYAADTLVTGKSTGTRIALNKSVSLPVTVRITLGYASGGYLYPWGYTEVPVNGAGVITPDLSRISGVAPAGTNLAMQVALVTNSGGDSVTVYVGDSRATGDASGTLVVDEGTSGTVTIADVATKEANNGLVVAPGSGAIVLDGFLVSTTSNTSPSIFTVTLAFDAGTAEAVSLVEVTDSTGATVYGSVSNPGVDTFDVALNPAIFATTTPTEYRVRVTPKSQTALPSVKNWTVRGVVYGAMSALPATITDADSARIVIDNLPPSPPSGLVAQAGASQESLGWTNPLNVDLSQVVVVRGTSATFTGAPVDGTTYAVGNAIGNGTVACVVAKPGATCTDTQASGAWYYQAFAVDLYGNYSAASNVAGPVAPGATTTLADGAPAAASVSPLCPGSAMTFADAFSLQASSGAADTVTGLTVRLAAGTSPQVAAVTLTDANNVVLATGTRPSAGDDWTFTGLSLPVPVSPAAAGQYRIQLTPQPHTLLPEVPGATYALTARVVGATKALSTNLLVTDTAEATLSLDNSSPAAVTGLTASSPGSGQMTVSWTSTGGYTLLARSTAPITRGAPAEGTATYNPGDALATNVAVACTGNIATCTDTGLVNGTTYYYRAFTRDSCANWSLGADVYGGPSVTLPTGTVATVTTQPTGSITRGGAPVIAGYVKLTAGASGSVTLGQIAVANAAATSPAAADTDIASVVIANDTTGAVLGVATWNASAARYVLSGLSTTVPAGSTLTLRVTVAAARAATIGAQFQLRVAPADVTLAAPAATAGSTVTGNAFAIVAGAIAEGSTTGYSLLPQVSIVNPSDNKVLSGGFRLQVHVWSPTANGVADLLSYTYSTNGSAPDCTGTAKTLTQSGNYQLGQRAGIFEAQVSTLPQGSYILRACARTSDGVVQARAVNFVVKAGNAGDGNLLVRDNSEQLCTDCHNLRSHSSETTSRKYGSFAIGCRDCHAPHGSKNTYLVKGQITPPAVNGVQAPRTVNFKKTSGDSGVSGSDPNASFINSDGTGPCQTCHTRTSNPWDSTVPRWRNTGNSDSHYSQKAGTTSCFNCHKHKNGFSPESRGGDSCDQCHQKIWERMSGTVAKVSRHPIGNVPGTNTSPVDNNISWTTGPLKTANDPSVRSCLNMCHPDKRHNEPGGWTHAFGVYGDPTTGTSRAVTRGSDGEIVTGNVSDSDFDATKTGGGLCAGCHQQPINSGGYTISKDTFGGTAHDFDSDVVWGTWGYTMRDGSRFRRNCTKCHSDRADKQPTDDTYPFGAVHYSDYPKLLAGSLKPGTDGQAVFLCFNCHGNGVIGVNRSNDLASPTNKFYAHPVATDTQHQLGDAEYNAAAWGNELGNGPGTRHASCLDCHVTHLAKRGGHSYISGTVSVAAGSTAVTGVDTRWTSFYVGGRIKFGSTTFDTGRTATWYTIASVASPTSLTLTAAPSTAYSGVPYRIEQMTNKAGPAVDGAWGVVPNWARIAAGAKAASDLDVTKKKLAYNSDLEAYLCMKCHSSYWWGSATPPVSRSGFSYYMGTASFTNGSTTVTGQNTTTTYTYGSTSTTSGWLPTANPGRYVGALIQNAADGTWYKIVSVQSNTQLTIDRAYAGTTVSAQPYAIQMAHTDQLQEFNPANKGYHPVFQSRTTQTGYGTGSIGDPSVAGKYWPVTQNILSPWTMTSTMTCSDCHEADTPNDAGGPHGSSYKFMLKGPNRIWDENVKNSSSGMPAGTFCANCHDATFPTSGTTKSRFPEHRIGDHAGKICFDCHNAIPHGSSSVGMLNNGSGTGFSDHVYPYDQSVSGKRLYINSVPSSGYFDQQSYCGCSSPSQHG